MNQKSLFLLLKGAGMGLAEVIPGVSGGTIAFITGIYMRLINAIKAVDIDFLSLLGKGRFKTAWKKIDGNFLITLGAGMLGGLVVGVFGISYFLENYPPIIWGVFFGLILASIPLVFKRVESKTVQVWLMFIIGAIVAFGITSLSPAQGNTHPVFLFVAGAIAIVALVLPGISGSFILLLLGLYAYIIPLVKSFLRSPELSELSIIAVFAAGCLTGLMLFSRVVSAAFHKYHDKTVALMSGFLLGSLNKIWPWRNPDQLMNKTTSERLTFAEFGNPTRIYEDESIKILTEQNVLPSSYFSEPYTLATICAILVAIGGVYLLSKLDKS